MISLSTTRLEVTATTPSKPRICVFSFSVKGLPADKVEVFAKKVKAAIGAGKTKSDILEMRRAWKSTL